MREQSTHGPFVLSAPLRSSAETTSARSVNQQIAVCYVKHDADLHSFRYEIKFKCIRLARDCRCGLVDWRCHLASGSPIPCNTAGLVIKTERVSIKRAADYSQETKAAGGKVASQFSGGDARLKCVTQWKEKNEQSAQDPRWAHSRSAAHVKRNKKNARRAVRSCISRWKNDDATI